MTLMTIDMAFLAGLASVRESGLPAKGSDVPVLAALAVFTTRACGKEHDDRFPTDGPAYARKLILEAYSLA